MQLLTALVALPAALTYCPADFAHNDTMAEGPCSGRSVSLPTAVPSSAQAAPSTVFISNGTAVERADLRLWNDDAFAGLEAVVPPPSYGAVSLGTKMDLGFYVPVSGVDGTCLKKTL